MSDVASQIRVILQSFVGDPPDTDFQQGYLAAALVIANEVVGIPNTDPLWQQADNLLSGDHAVKQERARPRLTLVKKDAALIAEERTKS